MIGFYAEFATLILLIVLYPFIGNFIIVTSYKVLSLVGWSYVGSLKMSPIKFLLSMHLIHTIFLFDAAREGLA